MCVCFFFLDSFTFSSRSTVIVIDIQFTRFEIAFSPILRSANPNGSDKRWLGSASSCLKTLFGVPITSYVFHTMQLKGIALYNIIYPPKKKLIEKKTEFWHEVNVVWPADTFYTINMFFWRVGPVFALPCEDQIRKFIINCVPNRQRILSSF